MLPLSMLLIQRAASVTLKYPAVILGGVVGMFVQILFAVWYTVTVSLTGGALNNRFIFVGRHCHFNTKYLCLRLEVRLS
jgi:hypothetical protein